MDMTCRCYDLEEEINETHPEASWNLDEACEEWKERAKELKESEIPFDTFSDEANPCTCPTCGRVVCRWCL